ncbi:hypothetical protein ACODT3_42435 [Streptomyces sp. 4.24]|uniref:hypothetical protein n=1 Tax=Streptomyces tritrimontium TaxID=3406573 RepID=UPI003BB4CF3E
MERSLRRSLISADFARQAIEDNFGPAGDLNPEDRAWRRESLNSAFKDYRDTRLVGAGADWRDALEDAAECGRIDLREYDGNLTAARDAINHGAIWEFAATPNGTAILDTSAL